MRLIVPIILAATACCSAGIALGQPAPPENDKARTAAWAVEALAKLENAGVWLAPPGSHYVGRKTRRSEAAVWFGLFLFHFPREPAANTTIDKERAIGSFVENPDNDSLDVYGYFGDVHFGSLGDWSSFKIEASIRRGLMRGDPSRRFRSSSNLTRGELATIVCRLLLYSKASIEFLPGDIIYVDVTGDEWWCGAAQIVSRCHAMQGFPDGTFRGEQPVTYDELIVTLARVLTIEKACGATRGIE